MNKIKILLDPGHIKNWNQSNVFKNYYEGNMTWILTNYLKEELESYGFEVGLTKKNIETDIAVYNRGFMAKGYDLFLSLHSNWCETESINRVVIIKQFDKGDSFAKELGQCVTDVMNINQTYQIMTRKSSNGGEYYGVLRGAKAVKVEGYIIEHSFHSNLNSTKWLYNNDNLKKLAISEAKVIAKRYNYSKISNEISRSFLVKVTTDVLNIRKGPAMSYDIVGKVKKGEVFTITEEKNGFLKLKSGAGWISKDYTKKL